MDLALVTVFFVFVVIGCHLLRDFDPLLFTFTLGFYKVILLFCENFFILLCSSVFNLNFERLILYLSLHNVLVFLQSRLQLVKPLFCDFLLHPFELLEVLRPSLISLLPNLLLTLNLHFYFLPHDLFLLPKPLETVFGFLFYFSFFLLFQFLRYCELS